VPGSRQWRLLSVPGIAADLIAEPTGSQPPGLDRRPAQLTHQLRQASAGTRVPATLRNLKDVEKRLRTDALDVVVADLAPDPL